MKRAAIFPVVVSLLVGLLAWAQFAPSDAAELVFPRDGIAGFREIHSGTVDGLWTLDSQGLLGSIPNDSAFSFFVGPTPMATQTASVSSAFRFERSVGYNAARVGIVTSSSIHRSITHLHCVISARDDHMVMRGGRNGSGDLAAITSQRLGRGIRLNVPYKLTLEVDGPNARCLLDDQLVLAATVRDLTNFPSQVQPALFVIEAEARFANLVTGGTSAHTAPQTAGIFGTNLIVNGNAEAGAGSPTGLTVVPVPGWTTVGNFTTIRYTAGGGFPTSQDPGPPDRGNNFFGGGPSSPSASASQGIDVSAGAATIDAGGVTFTLSGYLGGFGDQGDNAALTATFRGASGNSLGAVTLAPVTPRRSWWPDRNGAPDEVR